MDKVRQLAHDLIDGLSDEEVRLLIAYAHQIQEGHFAALTNGLEQLLDESPCPPPPAGPRPRGRPSLLPPSISPAAAPSIVSACPWPATRASCWRRPVSCARGTRATGWRASPPSSRSSRSSWP